MVLPFKRSHSNAAKNRLESEGFSSTTLGAIDGTLFLRVIVLPSSSLAKLHSLLVKRTRKPNTTKKNLLFMIGVFNIQPECVNWNIVLIKFIMNISNVLFIIVIPSALMITQSKHLRKN